MKHMTGRLLGIGMVVGLFTSGPVAVAADASSPAFKINGKVTTLSQVAEEEQGSFFEIDMKRFELVDRIAREKYLESFWQQEAKKSGKSIQAAQNAYVDAHVKVSEKEVKETIEKFKDHPQLKKLTEKEREKQVRDYLLERERQDVFEKVIESAVKKGDLVVMLEKPKEPVYQVNITDKDVVRYGPGVDDTKPISCKGKDCPITIVEYSEFQCPFCQKVMPQVKQVLTEYKGKIRWSVRDFPLNFHNRARPAAITAKCAAEQGKYWHMYTALFDNQQNLADEDLTKYAQKIGLDMGKYKTCVSNPAAVEKLIDENTQSGMGYGVNGTPAFFINGRKMSGALPYAEFKRVIDEELAKAKKS